MPMAGMLLVFGFNRSYRCRWGVSTQFHLFAIDDKGFARLRFLSVCFKCIRFDNTEVVAFSDPLDFMLQVFDFVSEIL